MPAVPWNPRAGAGGCAAGRVRAGAAPPLREARVPLGVGVRVHLHPDPKGSYLARVMGVGNALWPTRAYCRIGP
jgi:hypothetical protein